MTEEGKPRTRRVKERPAWIVTVTGKVVEVVDDGPDGWGDDVRLIRMPGEERPLMMLKSRLFKTEKAAQQAAERSGWR